MAKTLKTGDVKKFKASDVILGDYAKWVVLDEGFQVVNRSSTRSSARRWRLSFYEAGDRIAKIIKRTPKYVFVEVSK